MHPKLALAFAALRNSEVLEKRGGLVGGLSDIVGTTTQGIRDTGAKLRAAGHPIAGALVGAAPTIGAAVLAKKVYESGPVQGAMNKYRMWKYQRDMAKAQQAQQGYY